MKIICELYVNWYETLMFVYDIQALILYVIISNYTFLFIFDKCELYHVDLFYVITMSCLQLYAKYYVIYTYSIVKYGIITLLYKTTCAYCSFKYFNAKRISFIPDSN